MSRRYCGLLRILPKEVLHATMNPVWNSRPISISWKAALEAAAIVPFAIGLIFDLALGATTVGPLAGLLWLNIAGNVAILFIARRKNLWFCLCLYLANSVFVFLSALNMALVCYNNSLCGIEKTDLWSALILPVELSAWTFALNVPALLLVKAAAREKTPRPPLLGD